MTISPSQPERGNDLPRGRQFDRLINAHCAITDAPPSGNDIGFICSCFIRFPLPHGPAGSQFERFDGDFRATFMAPPSIGLPFGRVPRLLLIHFTTQAVRTRSRDIALGPSLSNFMKSLFTRPTGGRHGSIKPFKEQLLRTLSLSTTQSLLSNGHARLTNVPVADEFEVHWSALEGTAKSGLPAFLRLGERMFTEMLTRAVPVDLRAVRALQQSALALDVYFWTTLRTRDLPRTHPTRIPWAAIHQQFGTAYASQSDFAIAFRHALRNVQMVYPALRCSTTDSHLVLQRSSPSVPGRPGR